MVWACAGSSWRTPPHAAFKKGGETFAENFVAPTVCPGARRFVPSGPSDLVFKKHVEIPPEFSLD